MADKSDPIYQMLRELHLLAWVRDRIAQAADAMSRGMNDQAPRECRRIEAKSLDDLITLSKPDQPLQDLHMRPTASVFLVMVLNAGALVYMGRAVMGKNLRNAKRYFEKMERILEAFGAEQTGENRLTDVIRLAQAADVRVQGKSWRAKSGSRQRSSC